MRVIYTKETLNPNSTELKDLYLRNVYVGKYSYGTYSKVLLYKASQHQLIPSYENFICGILHKHFNIEIDNKNDIKTLMKICKDEYNVELIDIINSIIEKESKKYDF